MDISNLYSYQASNAAHLAKVLQECGAALDGSDAGTGKTRTVLAVARYFGMKPVVVCPKSVSSGWHREAAALGGTCFTTSYEMLTRGTNEFGGMVDPDQYGPAKLEKSAAEAEYAAIMVDPTKGNKLDSFFRVERARKALKYWKARRQFRWKEKFPLVIFDEIHRCKDGGTLNSKALVACRKQGIPVVGLSATAAENPMHLKALGFVLGLHKSTDFHNWCLSFGCSNDSRNQLAYYGGRENLRRLHSSIYPRHGVRTSIDDLGDKFPETQILAELYDVEGHAEIDAIYAEVDTALATLRQRSELDADPEHPLTVILRLRQKIEILKVPLLTELIEQGIENNQSVAVFVNYNATIDELRSRFPSAVCIRGGQTASEREEARAAFQEDRSRVILCNIQAGGVGIDLHDVTGKHQRLSLISPTYSAINLIQVLGRVRRAGGKSKSLQRIVLASDTVEEEIHKRLQGKLDNLSMINDGDLNQLIPKAI